MFLVDKLKYRIDNVIGTYFRKTYLLKIHQGEDIGLKSVTFSSIRRALPKLIDGIMNAKEIVEFVSDAFDYHLSESHNAEFEVCKHFVCKFAFWCEVNLLSDRESARRAYESVYGKNTTS